MTWQTSFQTFISWSLTCHVQCWTRQVSFDQCTTWLLRLDSETVPSTKDLPSLWAGSTKAGDIIYTPPGMLIVDKVVNEDSISVCIAVIYQNHFSPWTLNICFLKRTCTLTQLADWADVSVTSTGQLFSKSKTWGVCQSQCSQGGVCHHCESFASCMENHGRRGCCRSRMPWKRCCCSRNRM